jgi:AbrB family looped-hinge helix DNA binding protein
MAIAQSRLTAQGQISIPVEVRKKLGLGPGSVLEWDERNDEIVVRRVGKNTSVEIHAALFSGGQPTAHATIKEGVRAYIRKKHARR